MSTLTREQVDYHVGRIKEEAIADIGDHADILAAHDQAQRDTITTLQQQLAECEAELAQRKGATT